MAVADNWASGDAYEPYVGRWSRLVAGQFIEWLDVPAGSSWLDVGCGTGALSSAIPQPADILGIDPSAGFVDYAASRVPSATFRVGDAQALGEPSSSRDAVVAGLVLNFVPDPALAVAEMVRVSRGTVAAYVWDYAGGMELMRYFWDAAASVDPSAVDLHENARFGHWQPAYLASLFGGLSSVTTRSIAVPTVFSSFDDYWAPFLGGMGSAPSYLASRPASVVSRVREAVRDAVPVGADGVVALEARAWGVKGRV